MAVLTSVAFENAILDTITGYYASLHTASPGQTGASEVTGGTYARLACTLAAASSGTKLTSVTLTFNVPTGNTITHVGLWDAATVGNYKLGGPLNASVTYTADGTYQITSGALILAANTL